MYFWIALWGLNAHGNFKESSITSNQWWNKLWLQDEDCNVKEMVVEELHRVEVKQRLELENFANLGESEYFKNKHLIALFQRDLLPGISAQLLENAQHREAVVVHAKSRSAKFLAWVILVVSNSCMLMYIFLFAVGQEAHRQNAWSRSFGTWLAMEILLISTLTVVFTNVILPSLLMKDVMEIRKKMRTNLVEYYQRLNSHQSTNNNSLDTYHKRPTIITKTQQDDDSFNAAKYFYLSYKVATEFPELSMSKFILNYRTIWPKQSFQHQVDISKSYHTTSLNALKRSVLMIAIFFISNALVVPVNLQDMILQIVSTVTMTYVFILHIKLYQIYPVLIVIPFSFIGIMIHVITKNPKHNNTLMTMDVKSAPQKIHPEPLMLDVMDNKETNLDKRIEDMVVSHEEKRIKNRRESIQHGIQLVNQMENNILDTEQKQDEGVGRKEENSYVRTIPLLPKSIVEEEEDNSNDDSTNEDIVQKEKNSDDEYDDYDSDNDDNSFASFASMASSPKNVSSKHVPSTFSAHLSDSAPSSSLLKASSATTVDRESNSSFSLSSGTSSGSFNS